MTATAWVLLAAAVLLGVVALPLYDARRRRRPPTTGQRFARAAGRLRADDPAALPTIDRIARETPALRQNAVGAICACLRTTTDDALRHAVLRVLASLLRMPDGPPCNVRLRSATLPSGDFAGCRFGQADFREVRFRSDADFTAAHIAGRARFGGAQFAGAATFEGAIFDNQANFTDATVHGDATFTAAIFASEALFVTAHCRGQALFDSTTFTVPPSTAKSGLKSPNSGSPARYRPPG